MDLCYRIDKRQRPGCVCNQRRWRVLQLGSHSFGGAIGRRRSGGDGNDRRRNDECARTYRGRSRIHAKFDAELVCPGWEQRLRGVAKLGRDAGCGRGQRGDQRQRVGIRNHVRESQCNQLHLGARDRVWVCRLQHRHHRQSRVGTVLERGSIESRGSAGAGDVDARSQLCGNDGRQPSRRGANFSVGRHFSR